MREAQGFLLVFSITSQSSLQELTELREQIAHVKNDPNVPIVLVGNKADLEDDRAVSRSRAFAVSQSWGNVPYYETSARRRQNVSEVFIDVTRQIIRKDIARAREHPPPERSMRAGTFGRQQRSDRDRRHYHDDDDHNDRERNRDRRRRRRKDKSRCVIL